MAHATLTAGQRLRVLREAKRLTQEDVAAGLGVTPIAVVHWEADRFKPRPDTRVALGELLGFDPIALWGAL